ALARPQRTAYHRAVSPRRGAVRDLPAVRRLPEITHRPHWTLIMTHKLSPFASGFALCCALLAAPPLALAAPENEDMAEAATEPITPLLPFQELTADTLFLLLLGEIAGSRGDLEVSVEAYLHAARQTRDPRVARRATEIALVARDMESATSAA